MSTPTKIGKYEIRHQIGRGAMGVVFEAFDPVIERRVAIKILRLDIFDPAQAADVRTRFKREAQSAGQLAHPHIVTVHDYGEQDGTPYIVMEYLSGNELSKVLGRGARLPLSEVVRLMTQLLGALSYAHERKVVHRDVKPGNLVVLDDGSLKVVDFGLAHVEASNLTDTGALLGTPAYMSPEQFLALPVDERSDIFSAGVILYELLTGDKPFTGTVTSIMQKVLRQEPMEPSVLNPTISTAWDTVVRRAMAKKPDGRFQSARQFLQTIKQVFEKGTVNVSVEVTLTGTDPDALRGETLRPGPDNQQAKHAQKVVTPASIGIGSTTSARPNVMGLAIAVIGLTVTAGGIAFFALQRTDDDAELAKIDEIRWVDANAPKSADLEVQMKADRQLRLLCERRTKEGKLAGKLLQACVEQERTAIEAKAAAIAQAERESAEKSKREAIVAEEREAKVREATEKAAIDAKLAQERIAREKSAATRKSMENAQAEKVAAEKAARATEKEIQEKVSAEVARLEKLRAERAEAERVSAEKMSRSTAAPTPQMNTTIPPLAPRPTSVAPSFVPPTNTSIPPLAPR